MRKLLFTVLFATIASCSDDPAPPAAPTTALEPGELCETDRRPELKLSFDPPTIVVGPGAARPVRLTIEPDACEPATAKFSSVNVAVAESPPDGKFDLRHATYDFVVRGGVIGKTTVSATMSSINQNDEKYDVKIDLPVDVRDPTPPSCSVAEAAATGTLSGATPTITGSGALAKASVGAVPASYTQRPSGDDAKSVQGPSEEFVMPNAAVSVGCHDDLTPSITTAKLRKLGPAVSFTSPNGAGMAKPFRREIDFSIPINPAAFPNAARLRHLVMLYSGPRAKVPRPIAVANARIEPSGEDYVLKFSAPWLGTYQPAVEEDAGNRKRSRRITHRAVIGFSMGGGGAAVFGMRHHDKFDVIAPLGGPSDWTWLLWFVENYALGGFCPAGQTCPKVAPNAYALDEPLAHTMDFEHWFYEKGSGNGGSFPRDEYIQIFEDLALSRGNPNGWNTELLHMAPGPKSSDAWVKGPDGTDCTITVDPIKEDPDVEKQRERDRVCKQFRCDPKNAWRAEANYFDDEFNPDGKLPVISFCDGAQEGESPYTNTFKPGGTKPVNLALAVDLNKNGIRDEGEPVIRSGHEPYDDCGADGLCDKDEPGYDPITNPDPNQDDYDYQINPTGLEGNHRWDEGEPFRDYGLDGVPNTKDIHVIGDPGEGDGKYTEAPGLTNFYGNDPHSILSRRATDVPGGPMTDDAVRRLSVLSDGGVRDLFNFASVASHFTGQLFARSGANGLPLRSVAYYNGFDMIPGLTPGKEDFNPSLVRWADVADYPSIRYGNLDASRLEIEQGDGQHVGKANQLLFRLETAFFYVGRQWPDADRRLTVASNASEESAAPGLPGCQISGACQHVFTGPRTNRTGPISVSLPPGYGQKDNVARNVRYPVLYVLHGYGQEPKELEAVAIFTNNFMNVAERSYATRLPKFIIVYVDGRCRAPNGKPECIRGTFYMDSARSDGAKMDAWFDEVVDFIDQNYRTMGPADVEVSD